MKWIMLVSGILTSTMLYAAVAPQAALRSTFGETLQGPLAEIIVRNWPRKPRPGCGDPASWASAITATSMPAAARGTGCWLRSPPTLKKLVTASVKHVKAVNQKES